MFMCYLFCRVRKTSVPATDVLPLQSKGAGMQEPSQKRKMMFDAIVDKDVASRDEFLSSLCLNLQKIGKTILCYPRKIAFKQYNRLIINGGLF